jgi:hypothetical protein
VRCIDPPVPRPWIALDGEHDLATHAERQPEQALEPVEQRQLRVVVHRQVRWVVGDSTLETDRPRGSTQLLDRDAPELAPLDTPEGGRGQAGRPRRRALAETEAQAGNPDLPPGGDDVRTGVLDAAVGRA